MRLPVLRQALWWLVSAFRWEPRAQGAATNVPGTKVPAFLEIRPDNTIRFQSPFMEGGRDHRKLLKIGNNDGLAGWCAQAVHRAFDSEKLPCEQRAAQIIELLSTALQINHDELSTTRSFLGSLWRAKAYIRQHLADEELNAESVSRAIGLSTRQLSCIFELDGISITLHIWSSRLEQCRLDLQNRDLRHLAVSDVAFRWGLNHLGHFSRSYRNRFGETPSMTRMPGSAGSE